MRKRTGLPSRTNAVPLDDDQLMYIRMNPRSHTPFGLGPLEVAFETVNSLLERASFCRQAGEQCRGAICAVAQRGDADASMTG